MSDKKNATDNIKALAGTAYEVMDGVVEQVDAEKYIVDVTTDTGVTLYDIKLRAVSNEDATGLILLPTVGSQIVFAKVRGEKEYVLIATSELDKVIIDVSVEVVLNAPKTTFNGGKNKGLAVVDKVAERLNKLEKDNNDLKQIFGSWTPVPNDGGAALKGAVATWAAASLVATKGGDMENEAIKH